MILISTISEIVLQTQPNRCPPFPAIRFDVISGYYSQAAGALAALSFTAMVFLLQGGTRGRDSNALMALLVTVFTLVASMITYSVVAGEGAVAGRAAATELLTGLTFITAIFMLFHSLQLLLEDTPEYASVTKAVRWIVVVIIPVIGMMFLVAGTDDTEYLRTFPHGMDMPRRCDGSISVAVVGWTLIIAMTLLLTIANSVRWRARWAVERRTIVPIAFLITSVITLVLFGVLNSGSANFLVPRWTLILYTSLVAALLSGSAVIVRIGSHNPSVTAANEGALPAHDGLRDDDQL